MINLGQAKIILFVALFLFSPYKNKNMVIQSCSGPRAAVTVLPNRTVASTKNVNVDTKSSKLERKLIALWHIQSHYATADMQKDYFCPGTAFWQKRCPDNLFGKVLRIEGVKSQY